MSMKQDQLNKLHAMNLDELKAELLLLRKQQFLLRLKRNVEGTLAKPHQITQLRKNIARLKTMMSQKIGETHGN